MYMMVWMWVGGWVKGEGGNIHVLMYIANTQVNTVFHTFHVFLGHAAGEAAGDIAHGIAGNEQDDQERDLTST